MPEGDSIWNHAARLRPLLVGADLTGVFSRWPRVVEGLLGEKVTRVQTHGKSLLLHFSNESLLHVHLKMTGQWRFFRGVPPREDLGLGLRVESGSAGCYRVPTVERLDPRALGSHPVLSRLGPDVLADDFDPSQPISRAVPGMSVGEALLDQVAAAGIGNVYRSEILFMERQDPWMPIDDVPQPERLWSRAAALMRANLGPGDRNTTGRRRPTLWVYGRAGQACLRCGHGVRAARLGRHSRTVFWCPECQR